MLPRAASRGSFVSRSRELCQTIRLGRCSRNATTSLPVHPTFWSVPGRSAEAPTFCSNTWCPPLGASSIARPRERRGLAELRDVARSRDAPGRSGGRRAATGLTRVTFVTGDSYAARILAAIRRRRRARIERQAAQRDERRNRRVDDERRGSVERECRSSSYSYCLPNRPPVQAAAALRPRCAAACTLRANACRPPTRRAVTSGPE